MVAYLQANQFHIAAMAPFLGYEGFGADRLTHLPPWLRVWPVSEHLEWWVGAWGAEPYLKVSFSALSILFPLAPGQGIPGVHSLVPPGSLQHAVL